MLKVKKNIIIMLLVLLILVGAILILIQTGFISINVGKENNQVQSQEKVNEISDEEVSKQKKEEERKEAEKIAFNYATQKYGLEYKYSGSALTSPHESGPYTGAWAVMITCQKYEYDTGHSRNYLCKRRRSHR